MKKIGFLSAVTIVASSLLSIPATAGIAPNDDALTIQRDRNRILWAVVMPAEPGGAVRVHFRAPARSRGSIGWQVCSFGQSAEGPYRCGLEIGKGSMASGRPGRWSVHATQDGVTLDRAFFTVRS